MAKRALCLLLTLIALFMLSHTAAFAATDAEEPTVADSTALYSEIMATDASGVTVPFSTEPEATYSLAKYPVLTVAAISNYFGRIDAEYNEFTREFTVVYMLKSSKRLLSTDWTLTYDADLLTLDPEKNTIETICPIMKKVANMSVDDKKGVIRYAATDLDMFDFSTAEAAFVRIVFDVPLLTPEDSEITKVDLTVSDLVVTEPDPRTGKSMTGKEIVLVANSKVLKNDKTKLVQTSKYTTITPSTFNEETIKPATDDEAVTTVPPTTQKPTVVTQPVTKPKPAEKTNEAVPLLHTGTWYIALLILFILLVRDEEIALTCRTLARKDKSNPIHVGEPGVGKTAIVHGLVQAIKSNNVPEQLKDSIVYELSLGSLVAGTKYRGEFEERLKGIINDALSNDKIILYIDEIHQLIGAGATGSGSMDGAQILKPYLNDGSIKCIGATTYAEYKKYIESDAALMRRFKKIDVKEPTVEEAISILNGLKETYEKHHNVTYPNETLETAVILSKKYMTERFLPDKAIDLIDEAGAYINQIGAKNREVTKELIEKVLAEACNIPAANVGKDEIKTLKNLNNEMKKVVFGQDTAIDALVDSILISRAGLSNENKPMGTYLFVGPTGTGKTEVAKQLAEKMGLDFIRYDMSEYMEKHTASKLIGAPAGYVGYEEGGLLTEDIRKHPYCVLLLDEFEKAHEDIYNIFLQVMDNAKLTDNQGRTADFRNVIIIMTSNAGASQLGQKTLGFNSTSKDESVMIESVNKTFTPEFRNRLSGTIIFNSMNDDMAQRIAKRQIDIFKGVLNGKGITLKVSKNVIPTIAKKVLKPEFGGREIIRIVEKEIKPLFSKPIVFGELKKGDTCTLSVKDDTFAIKY